jgi:hypothetical protein
MDEKSIEFLEKHIPDMAKAATEIAYWNALATGYSVFLVEDDYLIEMYPDGSKRRVKPLEKPSRRVRKGQKLRFR